MMTLARSSVDCSWLLLAEGRISDLGSHFRDDGQPINHLAIAGLIGAVLIVIVATWLTNRYFSQREKRGFNSPRALFGELCRAHGLSFRERRLLGRIATSHGLEPGAIVFLRPDCFDEAALGRLAQTDRAEAAQLGAKLFQSANP